MKIADGPVTLEINGTGEDEGYERWRDYHHSYSSGYKVCYVHQLVAIYDGADPNKVFSNGAFEVHHKEQEWAGGEAVIDYNVPGEVKVEAHPDHYNHHVNGIEPDESPERTKEIAADGGMNK